MDRTKPLISDEDSEATVRERYQEELQALRKLQGQGSLMKRRLETVQRDKESAAATLIRIQSVRSKLESVCRQLQKQNKAIEEESLERMREDAAQRAELTEKFHHTIADVTRRMEEHPGDRDVLSRDRELLNERIKNLEEQLSLRDQHYAQQLKTKELQAQLLATRLRQQHDCLQQDDLRRRQLQERLQAQFKAEDQLRQQLDLYGSKFDQFHGTLQTSNDAFQNFRRDITKMTDRHRASVGSHRRLTSKAGEAADALTELQTDVPEWEQRAHQAETVNQKLTNLIIVLQKEVDQLKQEASVPPPPPPPPPSDPTVAG